MMNPKLKMSHEGVTACAKSHPHFAMVQHSSTGYLSFKTGNCVFGTVDRVIEMQAANSNNVLIR